MTKHINNINFTEAYTAQTAAGRFLSEAQEHMLAGRFDKARELRQRAAQRIEAAENLMARVPAC